MSRALARLAAGVFFVGLVGCSGGSGGGGGGGGSEAPLQYTGNTSPAAISESNAALLAAAATNSAGTAEITGAVSSGIASQQGEGIIDVGGRITHRVRALSAKVRVEARLTSAPFDQTVACDNPGGTVRLFGDIDQFGIGTINFAFTNCMSDGDTLAGTLTMRVDRTLGGPAPADVLPIDFTISFPRLSLRGSVNLDTGGTIHDVVEVPANKETITENRVALNLDTGRMIKSEVTSVNTYDNVRNLAPMLLTHSIDGRVFDSRHGFVTIQTVADLRFVTATQLFPSGGEVILTGASNRRIQVVANSDTRLTLGLDLDGVGGFERQVPLAWTDLTGPIGADLRDTDGDGMHNSWETVFGLKPGVDDAAVDDDHDGFSNLAEYLGGGNPTNGASIPTLTVGAPIKVASGVSLANSNTEDPGRRAIASDGTNYLLVSCGQNGATVGVFGLLISENGQVLKSFPISSDPCPQRPAVAFGGGDYLVVLQRGRGLVGIKVTIAGTVPNPTGVPISSIADGSTNSFPAIASDGNNYLVVWSKMLPGQSRIHAARVAASGSISEFPITSGVFDFGSIVAFGGANYLVVWTIADAPDVFGARVSPAGVLLDSTAIPIATGPDVQRAGGVAFDGTNYLVVWDHGSAIGFDNHILGRRVTLGGTLLDGAAGEPGIAISTGATFSQSSSVAFAGNSFLVTWAVGSFSPPAGIFAARVSQAGVRIDGDPATLGVPISGLPSAFSRLIQPFAASKGQRALIAWVNHVELPGTQNENGILAAPVISP